MAGKPSYTREEVIFVLELMVADRFNDEISNAFEERFGRALTDNQIRYLRNKYGKDLDYGAPLAHKPATGKLKRRRAAGDATLPEASHRAKRVRQEVPTATPEVTPQLEPLTSAQVLGPHLRVAYPMPQFPTSSNQSLPQEEYAQIAGVHHSLLPAGHGLITLPQASGQGGEAPTTIASWNHRPELNFSTSFQHTNIQFGQGQVPAEPPMKLSAEFQRTAVQLGQAQTDPAVKLSPTFTSTGFPLADIPTYEQKTYLEPGAEAYSPEALIQPSHPTPVPISAEPARREVWP